MAAAPETPRDMLRLRPWPREFIPSTPPEAHVPTGPFGRPLCPLPRGHFICMHGQDEGCLKAKGGRRRNRREGEEDQEG